MTAGTPSGIVLVNIALLVRFRGFGIGTCVLRDLQERALREKSPLRLSVVRDNPALALYKRLGFRTETEDEVYCRMVWNVPEDRKGVNS